MGAAACELLVAITSHSGGACITAKVDPDAGRRPARALDIMRGERGGTRRAAGYTPALSGLHPAFALARSVGSTPARATQAAGGVHDSQRGHQNTTRPGDRHTHPSAAANSAGLLVSRLSPTSFHGRPAVLSTFVETRRNAENGAGR